MFWVLATRNNQKVKGELHSKNKLYSYETYYFNQLNPEILQCSYLQLTRNSESKREKSPSFRRHVVFLEQTRIVSGFHILTSLSAFSLDGIVVLQAITMNIVVERSSDDDYFSLSSCSSLGENLDEFLNTIYKQQKFRGYRFQAIRDCYNSKSSESLEPQMEEADEDVALARLGNLNW